MNSSALARRSGTSGSTLATALAADEWTREYLDTIRNVFGKGCTDAEFALAVQASKTTGLRIDTRELWVYKRSANDPMTLTISIDGFRAIAHSSGVYAGEEGPFYCGKDGAWSEVWLGESMPHAAKFLVYRADFPRPFSAVVLYSEFAKLGGGSPVWAKAPLHMLGIRAATHAYRKAFRQEIARRELDVQAMGAPLATGGQYEPGAIDAEARYVPLPTEEESPLTVDPSTGEILSGVDIQPADYTDDAVAPPQSDHVPSRAEQDRIAAIELYEAAHDAWTGASGGAAPTYSTKEGTKSYPREVPAAARVENILATTAKLREQFKQHFGE